MIKNLYLSLSATMIVFALCISLTLTAHNYVTTKEFLISHEQYIIDENINKLLYALETSDKVIYHFGNDIADNMYEKSMYLKNLYKQSGTFEDVDFNALSEQYSMDISIINEHNVIEYSNLSEEVGLDFNKCCSNLADILNQRRQSSQFYHDGLDVEQASGELKKYSYMSTADNKYLIQLGVYWKDFAFYEEFQFNTVANEQINDRVKAIRFLNIGGIPLGEVDSTYRMAPENMKAFKAAIDQNEIVELESTDQSTLSYFYVPNISHYDFGYTNKKVIEIVYDKSILNLEIKRITNAFLIQIGFIIIISIILSLLIARKLSTPIFLAFHDSLTKLGNRAYLQEYVNRLLFIKKPFSLIVFDMDNFKMVNDRFGHTIGDKVLKQTANLINSYSQNQGYSFRLGGDEFVTILCLRSEEEVRQTCADINKMFKKSIASHYPNDEFPLSISIGVSFAYRDGNDLDEILKAADEALYSAKRAGKGQYKFYFELHKSD